MKPYLLALLVVLPLAVSAQTHPSGACPSTDLEDASHKQPNLAEVITKRPAMKWSDCDSPKGCLSSSAQSGSPVQIFSEVGEWTCGYGTEARGAGPAWYRSKDLKPVPFTDNPPLTAWYGAWSGGEDHMTIYQGKDDRTVHLLGHAVWHGIYNNEHFGSLHGETTPSGNRIHFAEDGCVVDLTLAGPYLLATDNEGCGALNARFSGVWRRVSAHRTAARNP